jgi:hypothetical protein
MCLLHRWSYLRHWYYGLNKNKTRIPRNSFRYCKKCGRWQEQAADDVVEKRPWINIQKPKPQQLQDMYFGNSSQ